MNDNLKKYRKCVGIMILNDQKKILVINVMGRVFMNPLDDPFDSIR